MSDYLSTLKSELTLLLENIDRLSSSDAELDLFMEDLVRLKNVSGLCELSYVALLKRAYNDFPDEFEPAYYLASYYALLPGNSDQAKNYAKDALKKIDLKKGSFLGFINHLHRINDEK